MATAMKIEETIRGPHSEASIQRGEWHAYREDDVGANMRISKVTSFRNYGKFEVTWSGRSRGRWWKQYRATFATLTEAEKFAAEKWPVLLRWIGKQPAERPGSGAAGEFSALVASMRR
jgi:hypothetical protein